MFLIFVVATNQNNLHKYASYSQLHYLQPTPTSLGNFYPLGPPLPRNFWPSRGGVWVFSGFTHFDIMCDLLLNWCTTTWNQIKQIDKTPEGIWYPLNNHFCVTEQLYLFNLEFFWFHGPMLFLNSLYSSSSPKVTGSTMLKIRKYKFQFNMMNVWNACELKSLMVAKAK